MDDQRVPLDPTFEGADRTMMATAKAHLKPGVVYPAVVQEVFFPNGTCSVAVDGTDVKLAGCCWAAGILSGMMGFRTSYMPPPKTKVLILYTGEYPTYIIGCCPTPIRDPEGQTRPTVDGETSYHNSDYFNLVRGNESQMYAAHKPPIDLVEGEIQIDNLLGVGLTLLRHMSKLQAGDLASVECHVLNDMVRIVSDTFQHYTAFGEHKIINDGGKLNVEWHGTSHDFEAWGNRSNKEPKASLSGENRVDMEAGIDGFLDNGRWRFSQYIGWLGDFIHMFVTDPVEQLGRIASDQIRSGKSRFHIAPDGAVLLQSVADIVLEKVVRIPVPIRIRPEGHPQGNKTDDAVRTLDPLKTWKPSNSANLFEMVFQLREYARWLNNQAAFARFRLQDREFRVPTEAETPAPKLLSGEVDREQANPNVGLNWQIAYSTIRIYRDGSIQMVDAYGNSWTSTKTGVIISSTTDILLQAAGSVNVVAGQSVNLVARRDVGISAVTGGLWLRAQTGLQALVQAGNFIIDLMGSAYTKIVGGLNVNNAASITPAGEANVLGGLTADKLTALATNGPFGIPDHDPHMFHIFMGAPVVSPITDVFLYPSSYEGQALYETLSQQTLRAGEQPSTGDWNFEQNTVPGKGSPWPGEDIAHRVYDTTESLQVPSDKSTFAIQPKAVEAQQIVIKYV